MARKRSNSLATPKSQWPQVKGGKNMGRGVNGGSKNHSGKRGEASQAFPVVEWVKPGGK